MKGVVLAYVAKVQGQTNASYSQSFRTCSEARAGTIFKELCKEVEAPLSNTFLPSGGKRKQSMWSGKTHGNKHGESSGGMTRGCFIIFHCSTTKCVVLFGMRWCVDG